MEERLISGWRIVGWCVVDDKKALLHNTCGGLCVIRTKNAERIISDYNLPKYIRSKYDGSWVPEVV